MKYEDIILIVCTITAIISLAIAGIKMEERYKKQIKTLKIELKQTKERQELYNMIFMYMDAKYPNQYGEAYDRAKAVYKIGK